ncbi:MAG: hypothetical protein J6R26_00705, partial [Paludibacteraceae bacterium]|nr:hypothetical protein [Paludibacteraceae bacterium]
MRKKLQEWRKCDIFAGKNGVNINSHLNKMLPETLYIIGNGFDLYHGAQSSYWAFRQYLLRCAPEVVMAFDLYWGPGTLLNSFEHPQHIEQCLLCNPKNYHHSNWTVDHLWADFERYLAELNREKVMTLADWYLPKIDEDDERFSYAE